MKIEKPKKRPLCDMSGWYRVIEADGSTVAYCPDIVTARQIAATSDLYEALNELSASVIEALSKAKRDESE